MQENYLDLRMKLKNGKLVPLNDGYKAMYDAFIKTLEEEQPVYVLLDAASKSGSFSQKRLLCMNIRKVAEQIGDSYQNTQAAIKQRCGLEYKSIEDCSKDELSILIEEVKLVCNTVGIPFIGI